MFWAQAWSSLTLMATQPPRSFHSFWGTLGPECTPAHTHPAEGEVNGVLGPDHSGRARLARAAGTSQAPGLFLNDQGATPLPG